jgi:membrane protease YdiL (CAAX protease family)
MFIRIIRGAAVGLSATALIGMFLAIYDRTWVAALFAGCAFGMFLAVARLVEHTTARARRTGSGGGPFSTMRGRRLLVLLAGGFLAGSALAATVTALTSTAASEYARAAMGFGLYGFIALGMWAAARRHKLDFARLRGRFPDRRTVMKYLAIVVPLLLFSYGTVWVVYYPLSVFSPELVDALLLGDDLFLGSTEGAVPIGPNVLSALALVVLAPVTEEVFFRGYLLHRWAVTWGIEASVVASSVVFASLHADPLGALLFGFAMAVVYLETRSLGLVIVCHILNNLLAYAAGVGTTLLEEPGATYSIGDFQREWWMAAIALLLSLPWAVRFVRSHWPDETRALPYEARPQ